MSGAGGGHRVLLYFVCMLQPDDQQLPMIKPADTLKSWMGPQVAFAPLPTAPKPVATKPPVPGREPSRDLTASEQFLAQARASP